MILYKYLTAQRGLQVLRSRKIRFTQPGEFNDPYEFRPTCGGRFPDEIRESALKEAVEDALRRQAPEHVDQLRELLNSKESLKAIHAAMDAATPGMQQFLENWLVTLSRRIGLLCLSEPCDSILMWGHYTDCHRGIVVGFDSDHPFFSKRKGPSDEFGFLRQVRYQRDRPALGFDDADSARAFQTKFVDWAYEKEWRIARPLTEASDSGSETPYPVCLFEFPPALVREIIVGLRADKALTADLRALLPTFPRASLLAASEHTTEYRLVIRKL